MSLKRWNPRRDQNERAIVRALEKAGALVFQVSEAGLPDLLTYFRGRWLPVEIKRERLRRSLSDRHGKSLTPSQCATYAVAPFPIVQTPEEALKAIGALR